MAVLNLRKYKVYSLAKAKERLQRQEEVPKMHIALAHWRATEFLYKRWTVAFGSSVTALTQWTTKYMKTVAS